MYFRNFVHSLLSSLGYIVSEIMRYVFTFCSVLAGATTRVSRIKNQASVCCVCVRAPFTSLYMMCFFMCTLRIFLLLTLSVLVHI